MYWGQVQIYPNSAALILVSDECRYANSENRKVDGGWMAG